MDILLILVVGGAILLLFVVAPGMYLWIPTRKEPASRSDMGVNLLTGALVAFAILVLQVVVEHRLGRIEDQRRKEAEQQNLLLQVGLKKDLTGIPLDGKDLRTAYLAGKILTEAHLVGAHLEGATLSRARLARANLTGAYLHGAQLDGVKVWTKKRQPSNFETPTARFDGADLTGDANLAFATLVYASFVDARLQDANLNGARLDGAILADAHLSRANFAAASLRNANLRGADLTNTDLSPVRTLAGAALVGAKYDSRTFWPRRWPITNPPTKRPRKCPPFEICRIR